MLLGLILNYGVILQRFKDSAWEGAEPIIVLINNLTVIQFCSHKHCDLLPLRMLFCFSPDLFWSSNPSIRVCKLRWALQHSTVRNFWTHWLIGDAVGLMSVEFFWCSHSKTVFSEIGPSRSVLPCIQKTHCVANVE